MAPMGFSDPDGLRRAMEGAGVLYNTYWITVSHTGRPPSTTRSKNTRTLFEAASERAFNGWSTSQ